MQYLQLTQSYPRIHIFELQDSVSFCLNNESVGYILTVGKSDAVTPSINNAPP